MGRYDNEGSIKNAVLGDNVKDFLSYDWKEKLISGATTGKILQGMQYRPDLVSTYYLGSPDYAWIITLINGFIDGIKEYEQFKEILIPSINTIRLYNL